MTRAFRVGVDEVPEWFRDQVGSGAAVLNNGEDEIFDRRTPVAAIMNCGAGWELVGYGEWIIELADGGVTFCSHDVYEMLYGTHPRIKRRRL